MLRSRRGLRRLVRVTDGELGRFGGEARGEETSSFGSSGGMGGIFTCELWECRAGEDGCEKVRRGGYTGQEGWGLDFARVGQFELNRRIDELQCQSLRTTNMV